MSAVAAALGAAITAVGVVSVAIARTWPGSTGRRRAGTPVLVSVEAVEALEKTAALCTTEGRITVHARTRVTRELVCLDCRNPSLDLPLPAHIREEAS
ncbi:MULTISPECIES: hypothetical protein [Streptomyces]|uniref:hypothetical protein n=1 Tax=Streptomyces TaxID=1883 RepID=UPI0016747B71|nr:MULTISPECIES: hypothetical protein [Streptomyces]MBK3524868.1 hypothetical protein [Streptomyces sp. MBT70]GGR70822.1 hypothetical protein GCM10010236_26310 [Streptomyces eurythermus]